LYYWTIKVNEEKQICHGISIISNSHFPFALYPGTWGYQRIAGMGDALSTWFEANACYKSSSRNEADGRCTLSALALAKLCYDTILEYGLSARESCRLNKVTPALEKVIEANTLMSGLGFESAGLFLSNQPVSLIDEVYTFCASVGLPVTLEQIGVAGPTVEDLQKVASAACASQESIWHEPVEITPDRVAECLKLADDHGKRFRSGR